MCFPESLAWVKKLSYQDTKLEGAWKLDKEKAGKQETKLTCLLKLFNKLFYKKCYRKKKLSSESLLASLLSNHFKSLLIKRAISSGQNKS